MNTDNFTYEKASDMSGPEMKPFLQKNWIYLTDQNNSGVYSNNQVEFNTASISANGRYMDWSQALIYFPLVITVSGVDDANAVVNFQNYASDAILNLKNSHANIIHSLSCDYSNNNIIQNVPYLNQLINFNLISTLNNNDIDLIGDVIGFAKDTSSGYIYNEAPGAEGDGICNNINFSGLVVEADASGVGDISNSKAIKKRQSFMGGSMINGREKLMATSNYEYHVKSGNNTIVTSLNSKSFYYDCSVRLSDLNDFFKNVGLIRGANMRLNMTLNNNVSFRVTRDNTSLTSSNFQNTTSLTNPLQFACIGSNHEISTVQENYARSADSIKDVIICGGSIDLPNGDYTVQMSISKPTNQALGVANHCKTNCRLYVPSISMNPTAEAQYLLNNQRLISYTDYEFQNFKVASHQSFQYNLTPSTAGMKRLIVIVHLDASENGTAGHVLSSPFSDNLPSPHIISGMNLTLSGTQLYPLQFTYSYEQFLNEMNAGMHGLNGGIVDAVRSGMISRQDYEQNYKFYCFNLSRRMPEDELVPQSLSISGRVDSPKNLEFFCYIEKAKSLKIDVSNGMRLEL